jgi:hypothetical protein
MSTHQVPPAAAAQTRRYMRSALGFRWCHCCRWCGYCGGGLAVAAAVAVPAAQLLCASRRPARKRRSTRLEAAAELHGKLVPLMAIKVGVRCLRQQPAKVPRRQYRKLGLQRPAGSRRASSNIKHVNMWQPRCANVQQRCSQLQHNAHVRGHQHSRCWCCK